MVVGGPGPGGRVSRSQRVTKGCPRAQPEPGADRRSSMVDVPRTDAVLAQLSALPGARNHSGYESLKGIFAALLEGAIPPSRQQSGPPAGLLAEGAAISLPEAGTAPPPLMSSAGGHDAAAPAGENTPEDDIDPLAFGLAPAYVAPQAAIGLAAAPNPVLPAGAPAWESAVLQEVVRRVSWGGDRRRGTARIELAGALAGTTILVHGEGREVSLEIAGAPSVDGRELGRRIEGRLAARGLEVGSIDVR